MGKGNGRRQHFACRHITNPADAARISSRKTDVEKTQGSFDIMVAGLYGLTTWDTE